MIVSIALGSAVVVLGNIHYDREGPMYLGAIWLGVACSVYAIIANAAYIWIGMKGKIGVSGASVAHFGFGLVLLGILLSSSKKEVLSYNKGMPVDFGKDSKENPGENLTLIRGLSMPMGKFDVTYLGDSAHPKKQQWYFKVHFKSRTDDEEFTLLPDAFVNYKGNEGLMANPSSKHYIDHDIFTYITSLPNPEKNKDTSTFRPRVVGVGDTVFYSNGYMILDRVVPNPSNETYQFTAKDTALMAEISVFSKEGPQYHARPVFYVKDNNPQYIVDSVISQNLTLAFTQVTTDRKIVLQVKESNTLMKYITLKAYKFPFINVLWIGVIITAIGILMSMIRRIVQNRRTGV
jgi:cytochrome c-type biogenesis protein CcmF